jgi:hypothetical protein
MTIDFLSIRFPLSMWAPMLRAHFFGMLLGTLIHRGRFEMMKKAGKLTDCGRGAAVVLAVAVAVDMRARMCRQRCRRVVCLLRNPGTTCASKPPVCRYTTDPEKIDGGEPPKDPPKNGKRKWGQLWAAWREIASTTKPRLWAAWREIALGRINEATAELAELDCVCRGHDLHCLAILVRAREWLGVARIAVERRPSPLGAWSGVDVERAWVNIHAAEVALIRLSDPVAVKAKIPNIIFDAEHVLGRRDERFKCLDEYNNKKKLKGDDREFIAESVKTVYAATTKAFVQARSFRNILFSATFFLTLFAIAFGILSARLVPEIIMCGPTCPPPPSLHPWQVELLGLFGASIIGSIAIRRMRGSSQPYAILMASLLVKLPLGALTAAGGLMLIHAGFLSPIFPSPNTAQLVAYAVIFGASQQTFTRLIDRQAQQVLDHLPSANRDAASGTSPDQRE